MPATEFLAAPWAWPRGVRSELLEAPAEEPLTLAQGKLRAGLDGAWPDGDPRDELMTGWIAAARQQVELDTGLALIRQVRLVTFTVTADSTRPLPLPMHALPLLALADADGNPLPVVELPSGRGHVHVVGGAAPVVLNRVQGTIVLPTTVAMPLRVTSGWPDRATFAKEAPLLLQAVGLLTAHYATLGRDLAGTADTFPVPMGYEAAVAPHRLIWIT